MIDTLDGRHDGRRSMFLCVVLLGSLRLLSAASPDHTGGALLAADNYRRSRDHADADKVGNQQLELASRAPLSSFLESDGQGGKRSRPKTEASIPLEKDDAPDPGTTKPDDSSASAGDAGLDDRNKRRSPMQAASDVCYALFPEGGTPTGLFVFEAIEPAHTRLTELAASSRLYQKDGVVTERQRQSLHREVRRELEAASRAPDLGGSGAGGGGDAEGEKKQFQPEKWSEKIAILVTQTIPEKVRTTMRKTLHDPAAHDASAGTVDEPPGWNSFARSVVVAKELYDARRGLRPHCIKFFELKGEEHRIPRGYGESDSGKKSLVSRSTTEFFDLEEDETKRNAKEDKTKRNAEDLEKSYGALEGGQGAVHGDEQPSSEDVFGPKTDWKMEGLNKEGAAQSLPAPGPLVHTFSLSRLDDGDSDDEDDSPSSP